MGATQNWDYTKLASCFKFMKWRLHQMGVTPNGGYTKWRLHQISKSFQVYGMGVTPNGEHTKIASRFKYSLDAM